jgi:hypothetical protein
VDLGRRRPLDLSAALEQHEEDVVADAVAAREPGVIDRIDVVDKASPDVARACADGLELLVKK